MNADVERLKHEIKYVEVEANVVASKGATASANRLRRACASMRAILAEIDLQLFAAGADEIETTAPPEGMFT